MCVFILFSLYIAYCTYCICYLLLVEMNVNIIINRGWRGGNISNIIYLLGNFISSITSRLTASAAGDLRRRLPYAEIFLRLHLHQAVTDEKQEHVIFSN